MINRVVLCSHVGNSRDNQEDNALLPGGQFLNEESIRQIEKQRQLLTIATDSNPNFLAAVSDGMGGHACGEVASRLTVEALSKQYSEIILSVNLGENALAEYISRINAYICYASQNNNAYRGMGATLCGVVVNGHNVVGFNVGDSRLYQFKGGNLSQLSTDHTEGQRLVNMKLLTEEEAKKFPRRKVLHKHLGYNGTLVPDVFRITDAVPGSLLMLCTDGLSDVLSSTEIEQILITNKSLQEKASLLVTQALSRDEGHGDNITVMLIEF